MNSASNRLRIAFQQPALPWYRDGLFSRLTIAANADVHVFYDGAKLSVQRTLPVNQQFQSHPVHDVHLLRGRLIWSTTQLRLASSTQWDWVVLSWNSRYISLPIALIIARFRRRRIALWGHGFSPGGGTIRPLYRTLLAYLATRILVYSERGRINLPPSVRSRTVVVGNTQFRNRDDTASSDASHLSRERCLRLVHIGRLRPDRKLEVGLDAVHLLRTQGWKVQLLIVGDGPDRSRLQRKVRDMDLEACVEFAATTWDDGSIGAIFSKSDVAMLGAAGGLGVIDALDHAVPVVLWGEQSGHGPEADLIFEVFPDLVDVAATPAGIAATLERAATCSTVLRRVEWARSHIATERKAVIERFCSALSVSFP